MSALKIYCFILLISCARSSPIEQQPKDTVEYRLPEGAVEVTIYDVHLTLEKDVFQTNKFSGVSSVLFKNMKETNEIKIHANRMTFSEILLVTQNGQLISLENEGNFQIDEVTDILTLTTSTPLVQEASYLLRFNYTAELRTDEMYGFYKSWYIAPDGTVRYLATTQFQPTHARKAFPCFDEPLYKAEFDIKITHPSEYMAAGNTRKNSRLNPDDQTITTTTFVTTPRMSTYLIAFVVSDFTCTEGEDLEPGVAYAVCSRDEAKDTREIAVEVGPKLTKVLEEFTGIKYSESTITKMDQFAIPDFSAGAMENWGLLTYRETGLLWDEKDSSNLYRQRLENVVSHEIAHMWFGNLVTTHWWSDTFLNEGFARYFQYFGTAEIEPAWELDKQFAVEQVQAILLSDTSPNSAPLSSPASSPAQVSGRFSSISYNKGASVFRMVKHFMGEDKFKAGIQTYLSDNKFGSTKPEHLWSALQPQTSNLPDTLDKVMENWVTKGGFPVLDVKTSGVDVVVSQQRFLSSGTPSSDDKWYVPISYTISNEANKFADTSTKAWLLPSEPLTIRQALNQTDWIILNNQQIGYYRINYDQDIWLRIRTALNKPNFDGIHVLNRAQIVDDFYNFAKVSLHPFSEVLELFRFLKEDTSYYPWYSAFNAFSNMLLRTGDETIRSSLSEYILQLMDKLLESLDFDEPNDADHMYTLNRVQANSWACRLGQQTCIDKAVTAFQTYKTTKTRPDKNLRAVIYCNALRHSKDPASDWDFLWEEYSNTKLATEQATILANLGCTTDETVLNTYLRKSIDANSGIRQQDALSVFSAVYAGNPVGVDIAFDFLLKNYKEISEFYGSMNSLSNLISGLASRFTNEGQTDKLRDFIDNTPDLTESLQTSAKAALDSALINLKWTEEFEKQLTIYFTREEEDGTGTGDALKVGTVTVVATLLVLCHHLLQ
ncbi:aminopeptidase N-like [Tenebrio molitor]|uniref:aminopeptidase N-like n=1 Tax=Tenebrio molitor TaxID=7067 RepID=UPI003624774F